MSDELIEQIADLRRQVGDLQRDRITLRAAAVVSSDPVTRTFAADVAGAGTLTGIPAPAQFLPKPGDLVTLRLAGATPILEPERIAPGSITTEMIADTVTARVLRTASDGQRIEIEQVGGVGAVRMFSGQAGDVTGASLSASLLPDEGKTVTLDYGLEPGTNVAGPRLWFSAYNARLVANSLELAAATFVSGSLSVYQEPVGVEEVVTKGYHDRAKWTTVYEGTDTYSQTLTASLVALTGMSGSVVVPTGRQLQVEAYLPRVEVPAGGAGYFRLIFDGVGKVNAVVGSGSALNVPVTLTATATGTGAAVAFSCAAYGGGVMPTVKTAGDGSAPGPRIRYRII